MLSLLITSTSLYTPDATQLGTVDDVAILVKVFGVLMLMVSPIIIVALCMYFVNYIQKKVSGKDNEDVEKNKSNTPVQNNQNQAEIYTVRDMLKEQAVEEKIQEIKSQQTQV
jgi:predicted Holliday junction resolvase-like endonuclease